MRKNSNLVDYIGRLVKCTENLLIKLNMQYILEVKTVLYSYYYQTILWKIYMSRLKKIDYKNKYPSSITMKQLSRLLTV